MKVHDTIFGLIFLALGTSVLFAVRGFPNIPGQPVGPALFPGLIAVGLCVTGIMLVIKGLRQHYAGTRFEEQRQLHLPQKHKATRSRTPPCAWR